MEVEHESEEGRCGEDGRAYGLKTRIEGGFCDLAAREKRRRKRKGGREFYVGGWERKRARIIRVGFF